MKRLAFCLFFALPGLIQAQGFQYGHFEVGSITRLFADDVIVRNQPSTKGKVVAKLKIGFPIEILEVGEASEAVLWNYKAPWYKVRFETDGMQEGYIWGGLVGWGGLELENGELILVGPMAHGESYTGLAKAVKLTEVVDTARFTPFNMGWGDYDGYMGLEELQEGWNYDGGPAIIALSMGYEACGYANGESYFFYVDKELSYGFDRTDVSDAGVFSCGQEIEWAAANLGTANQIKVTQACTEYEWDEETGEEQILSQSLQESKYVWNGKRLVAEYIGKEIAAE